MAEPVLGTSYNAGGRTELNIDPDEVAKFSALADEWWNSEGSYKPLHRINPARLGYIRDRLVRHFDRDVSGRRPLDRLTMLDIGCGGGLVCEPLSRLGGQMTGIDASERNIGTARSHAARMGLAIEYQHMTAEFLVEREAKFDVVMSLEVIEHVPDINRFLKTCADLVNPGGALILSTLNRTPKSFLFGIVGAEYVLGWVPRGTHQWKRFVRPSEISAGLRCSNLRITDISGLSYDLKSSEWGIGKDISVNYMAFVVDNQI